jgi:mannose-1-phosphate guanylyltransferase/mannose-6-phosphate isomerase
MLHPVLLCGGSGTRLWPLSRQALPKQFLPLISEKSLLQETLLRLNGIAETANPIVVCNNDHRFLVADQILEIEVTPQALILEPVGRNTAPAIALAAFCALKNDSDAELLVLPSDHVIQNTQAFHEAVAVARELTSQGFLTTFGMSATRPETGYGYIEQGEAIGTHGFRVKRFVEKPDSERAESFLKQGGFHWNSGMFLLGAAQFLEELKLHANAVYEATKATWESATKDLDFTRIEEELFTQAPSISLDYAVMEKTAHAAVVPVELGWSDVGAYDSLWQISPKDANGNVSRGQVTLQKSSNCYVYGEKQMVALLGVDDLVVVTTSDAVLVTKKECAQDVKSIVDQLKAEGRSEPEIHTKVFRPWGSYEGIDRGDRFQVKQLVVKPGCMTSMQIHYHRSEHWVVVSGTCEVTLEDEKHLRSEDESIYVPLGKAHRIYNPGRIPLQLIEVQSGSYLEEDDIVRINDEYGRG